MFFKIDKEKLFIYIILIAFIPPAGIVFAINIEFVSDLLAIFRYLLGIGSLLFIFFRRPNLLNKFTCMTIFYFFELILSMKMNNTIYLTACLSFIGTLGFVILNRIMFKKNSQKFLKCYEYYFMINLFMQFVTEILFPDGLVSGFYGDNRVFFMGDKNGVTLVALFYLCVVFFSETMNEKKSICVYKCIFLDIVLIINHSSAAMASCMIFQGIYLLYYFSNHAREKIFKKIYKFLIFVIFVFIGYFIIYCVFGGNPINKLGIFTGIFGKTVSFSGRIDIWKVAVKYIQEFPVWGRGLDVTYDPWGNFQYVHSAHNTLLDIAVKHGIPALSFFAMICLIIFNKIRKTVPEKRMLLYIIFISFMIGIQFETFGQAAGAWGIMTILWEFSEKSVESKNDYVS